MRRANVDERIRASKLRRRIRRGKRPLSPDQIRWLAAYEEQHPPREGVTSVVDAIGAEAVLDVDEPEPDDEPREFHVASNGEAAAVPVDDDDEPDEPDEPDEEPSEPQSSLPPVERKARAEADLHDAGVSFIIRAMELNERVSTRALDMMERMAEITAQQSEQLVDAFTALAEQRAAALAPFDDDEPDEDAQRSRPEVDDMMVAAFKEKLGLAKAPVDPQKVAGKTRPAPRA